MLSKKSTTDKSDATRTNAAHGTHRTATDRRATHATVRSRAKATVKTKAGEHTPTADHLDDEDGVRADGPRHAADRDAFLDRPLPPPADIPIANDPETVTADDVATRKSLDEVLEERRARQHARGQHKGKEDSRYDRLIQSASVIRGGHRDMSVKDAVAEALSLEEEIHAQLAEQEEQKKAEAKQAKETK